MPAISFQSVSKAYSTAQGSFKALDGVGFDIEEGEFFGLLGPNGAGKTTTLEILEGLRRPTAGLVEILGTTWEAGAAGLRQRIGAVLQDTRFQDRLTVAETVRMFRSFYRSGIAVDTVDPSDLDAVRRWIGDGPVVVLGHSWGGLLAVEMPSAIRPASRSWF